MEIGPKNAAVLTDLGSVTRLSARRAVLAEDLTEAKIDAIREAGLTVLRLPRRADGGAAVTIELNPRQERMLYDAMEHRHFQSVDEALDEALRSIAAPAEPAPLPARLTPAEAANRIRELRNGNVLPAGVTIRSLIEEGRA